jgi:apolipoprotein N-acyltransferase
MIRKDAMVNMLGKSWVLAALGAVFYWISLPPCKQPWAAFVACAFLAAIVTRSCPLTRREYWGLWLIGSMLWLLLLQGVRLANPLLYPGWVALACYLAVYLPLFIGLARSLHHSFRFPVPVAAPLAWVSCELIRSYFATGFSACMLAHSQTPWPFMLPIASQLGGYGVSFIVMMFGAVIYEWVEWVHQIVGSHNEKTEQLKSSRLKGLLIYSTASVGTIAGSAAILTLHERWLAEQAPIKPLARILIVQEDMPTTWDVSREEQKIGWERYEQQTYESAPLAKAEAIDLVLWPESTFSAGIPWIHHWDRKPLNQPDWEITEELQSHLQSTFEVKLRRLANAFGDTPPAFLVGSDVWNIRDGSIDIHNVALWINPRDLANVDYYAKQHRVMFGEYIPILCWFPAWTASLGLPNLTPGFEAKSWQLPSGATVSPTICFEDVVPQLVRSNVVRKKSDGKSPNILINLTNDAWFRGSSILDHHLNNAILAAVENRRPMLVAANQGISAWIDGNGRVVRSLPRLEAGSILAEPIPDGRWGLWQSIGDWPARCVTMLSFLPLIAWLAKKFWNPKHLPIKK